MENLIIIWSGPAWHTAAIYAARANLKPLMFEGFMAGWVAAWWQLTTTTVVENFPWFPDWIDGTMLMMNMRQQSLNAWTRIETKTVDKVDLSQNPFKVFVWNDVIETKSIIIATWATAKRLWMKWEDLFRQKWISACAVCDGGLPMFRNQPIVVVWWWDVALEEAMHLSHFGSKVYVIVRRDVLRASKAMQDKAMANQKLEFVRNSEVQEAFGNQFLEWVKIKNKDWSESTLKCKWMFYAIGHTPNTEFLWWQVELDETWYIQTIPWTAKTSVEWVFAAWDVQDKKYRQAITSAWTWCMAALEAEAFVNN